MDYSEAWLQAARRLKQCGEQASLHNYGMALVLATDARAWIARMEASLAELKARQQPKDAA